MLEVVLLACDEARALSGVPRSFPDGHRATVVDSGSTDGSGLLAGAPIAFVTRQTRRRPAR